MYILKPVNLLICRVSSWCLICPFFKGRNKKHERCRNQNRSALHSAFTTTSTATGSNSIRFMQCVNSAISVKKRTQFSITFTKKWRNYFNHLIVRVYNKASSSAIKSLIHWYNTDIIRSTNELDKLILEYTRICSCFSSNTNWSL